MKRLFAIGVIWLGCACAWMILGGTLVVRSDDSSSARGDEVHGLWGAPVRQLPPRAIYREPRTTEETVTTQDASGQPVTRTVQRQVVQDIPLPLVGSDITVVLDLEHRRKGLMWFPTYAADFAASYRIKNSTNAEREVELSFPLAEGSGLYDGFEIVRRDGRVVPFEIKSGSAVWNEPFRPGEEQSYRIRYRTRGTSTWHYNVTEGAGQARNFRLRMRTDFANVDFPAGTLSPSTHRASGEKWMGTWEFKSLIATAPIGVELPELLNPGPLASKITFFAPVGLLFFFFVVAVFATAQGQRIHPLNYFFFGCAFFAFHLLFAYLVDHVSVLPSFILASLVSIFLVVTYARLFVGWRFALREMAFSQAIYLVLFSYSFFWSGFTGLAITIGAILTLFVMMQYTGRIDWSSNRDGDSSAAPSKGPSFATSVR